MQKIWLGIFWKVLSCGCFAGVNILVRFLSGGSPAAMLSPLPIYSIMFFQNLISMLFLFAILSKRAGQAKQERGLLQFKLTKIRNPWLQLLRILTATIGIGVWYLSLRYIPIPQAVAISFIAPVITTISAVLILKERLYWQKKLAIAFSMIGGFFIARPDQALMNISTYHWCIVLPIIASLLFALDKVLTRKLLINQETPSNLAGYLFIFMCPLCLIPCIKYGWVTPQLQQWPWLLLLGILGAIAHYTFNKAYALAEITALLPFGIARLILSASLSFVFFAEIPNTLDMWLGISIVAVSTVLLGQDKKSSYFKPKQTLSPAKGIG